MFAKVWYNFGGGIVMIYVKDIVNICKGELISGDENIVCINFTKDTRNCYDGDVYFGIRGENFDGNSFYKEAFLKGAKVCVLDNIEVIDRDYIRDKTVVLVSDSVKALQDIAKYKRELYDIPVVGITGSTGKTSVKDMIYKILSKKYKVLATEGNFNNEIGLPLTILKLKDEDCLVLEMGMNHFKEMHDLSNIAKPNVAVITNIGTSHIGNLGSRENILKAKLEILDGMVDGTLIINNDNDLLRTVKYDNLITVGIDKKSDYMVHDLKEGVFSSEFYINDRYVTIPVGSRAYVYNALLAYAVGKKLGVSDDDIVDALKKFKLTPHRLEVLRKDNVTIIDDTYNASLDSVKNALSMLSKVDGRKVFIFADILETDNFSADIHKSIGKECVDKNIDVVICVGELARYTYDIVKDRNIDSYYFHNNQELLEKIETIIKDGDTILVKGSHSMNLIEVVNYLIK